MDILIANIGNIRANEIKVLTEALNKKHRITLCTMSSGALHRGLAFSYRDTPVRVQPLLYKDIVRSSAWIYQSKINKVKSEKEEKLSAFDDIMGYEFDASVNNPADAISVMLSTIMEHRRPDLVICGINNGEHMGQDIYSSSNVAMAMESAFFGIPSIAVAVPFRLEGYQEQELTPAVEFIEKNVEKFATMKLPRHTFLNINLPFVEKYKDYKGVKVARAGRMTQISTYDEHTDNMGELYYWTRNTERKVHEPSEEYGRTWFDRGYIAITPFNYDATDYFQMECWDNAARKLTEQETHEIQEKLNSVNVEIGEGKK